MLITWLSEQKKKPHHQQDCNSLARARERKNIDTSDTKSVAETAHILRTHYMIPFNIVAVTLTRTQQ